MSKGYTVIWFTTDKNERDGFDSYEAAKTWAESNISPEVSGATVPNLPVELFSEDFETYAGRTYSGGLYWMNVNRYAAIVKN